MEVLCIGEVHRVLEGHSGDVNCTAWSPSSKDTLCSCSGDKTIRVWENQSLDNSGDKVIRNPTHKITAHKYYVTSCAFNPFGDILATTSSDNSIKLWSTESWSCFGELSFHSEGVRDCCFSPDGNLLASASDDETVRVWEVGSFRCITTIDKHKEGVLCCLFAPNGWLLATGARNGQFLFFDVYTGESMTRKRIITAHDGSIRSLALQPLPPAPSSSSTSVSSDDSQDYFFATGGDDCLVKIWKVNCYGGSGSRSMAVAKVAELTQHRGPVYSCDYHPWLPYLATGSADKSIIIWNITSSYEMVQRIEAHSRYVIHISFSPSGSFLATSSNDRTVKLWKLKSAGEDSTHQDTTPQDVQSVSVDGVPSKQKPSIISTATWSVGSVCEWADSVARQRNTPGSSVHPDDVRAADKLVEALEGVHVGGRSDVDEYTYKCPITCQVMSDPVVAADGFSYERSAITGWFSKGRRTSPVTNLPLTSTLLMPNRVLKMTATQK